MGSLTGRIFVSFTLFLITFIGYSSQIFIIWPWYGRELSVQLIALLLPFNILLCMLLWNYYLCVTVNPGEVPKSWMPDIHDDNGYEVKRGDRAPRYCRTCENYKPPRSHHCKQCRRCVLRMDHHCPWINNCVGHFNYGHFLRFLFFVDLACSYHATMVTRRVYYSMSGRFWDDPTATELIFIILNYTFCIPVLLAVGGFSIYHFNALLSNTTTIEGWEKDKAALLVRRGKIQEIKFPYNLGRRRNIAAVLGESPWLWCWPTITPGNGLKYPVVDALDGDTEDWPPRDQNRVSDQEHRLEMPSSPWTYENGDLNPTLLPSGSRSRVSSMTKRRKAAPANVPPYHPDYKPPGSDIEFSDSVYAPASDDDEDVPIAGARIRRGSEGYEVRSINREEILRQHVVDQMHEPGRYNVYVPDPLSDSEDEENTGPVPLTSRVQSWRAGVAT